MTTDRKTQELHHIDAAALHYDAMIAAETYGDGQDDAAAEAHKSAHKAHTRAAMMWARLPVDGWRADAEAATVIAENASNNAPKITA